MSKTEAKSRIGEGVSPAEDVKQAVSGFMSEFKGFRADIYSKLKQTEERVTMLDRKSVTAARPHLAAGADMTAPTEKR